MEQLSSYLDFAENDYCFFRQAYDANISGGALASLGQNICERYLKHIISEYAMSDNKGFILKTHSLNKLMHYISDEMGIEIPEDTEDNLARIDSFYFTTIYPGEDSFIPTQIDVNKANIAVESARDFVLEFCHEHELEFEYFQDDIER